MNWNSKHQVMLEPEPMSGHPTLKIFPHTGDCPRCHLPLGPMDLSESGKSYVCPSCGYACLVLKLRRVKRPLQRAPIPATLAGDAERKAVV